MKSAASAQSNLVQQSERFIEKANKLLAKKQSRKSSFFSRLIHWGYDKKESKILGVYHSLCPSLQEVCSQYSDELQELAKEIERNQSDGFSFIILLKLSYCLHQSRSYFLEELQDQSKRLKFSVDSEIAKVKAALKFNQVKRF